MAQLREQMDEATFQSAWEAGRALPIDDAIQFALSGGGELRLFRCIAPEKILDLTDAGE